MTYMLDIVSYVLTSLMVGVAGTWIWLIYSMLESFKNTPILIASKKLPPKPPKVSVILPARNEESYISRCLDSLLDQDYPNYEIIAINDSSSDNTGSIIQQYAHRNSKIHYVSARPKPKGWMGKNWACMEGYKEAQGTLLLFTDSDTYHAPNVITLAVSHLLGENLDALTAIPKMLSLDFWTKVTLPMISTFLHTRFSALRVNDPSKKTGYFFGSFFIITRQVYDAIGTHEGVKHEIIEDGALGKKVKESGYKMKMVRGDHLVEAIWARDLFTLWHALKRLMIPLYLQSGNIAWGIFFAVLFLLFAPFPIALYAFLFMSPSVPSLTLLASSLSASALIYVGGVIETKALQIKSHYSILSPLGSLVVVLGFFAGLLDAKKDSAVTWRGRSYSMKDHIQKSISI